MTKLNTKAMGMQNVYKIRQLALIFLVCIFLTACKKNDSTNNSDPPDPPTNSAYQLTTDTYEIDNATINTIQSVDSASVVFSGNTSQLQNFKIGNIIVSGISKNAPFGFLRKIIRIEKNGNTYKMITSDQVPLTEAFKELHVDYTRVYSIGDTIRRPNGAAFSIEMPNIVLYDGDGNTGTTSDQIRVNGSMTLVPTIHVNIDIGLKGLLPSLTSGRLDGGFEAEINETIIAGGNIGSISKEVTIFSKALSPFSIPAVPFLVVVPYLRVSLGATGSINVSIEASHESTIKVNSYLQFENEKWEKSQTQSMAEKYTFSGINGSANAKVYLEPAIDFKLYNSNWATGTISAQLYLRASGQISPTKDCELKAGISAGMEANLKLFAWKFTAASYPSIFDYSKILYRCSENAPSTATDIDGNVYATVKIGTQTWMKENLKTSHYRNGDAIQTGLNNSSWANTNEGAYAVYGNQASNNTIYGKLYNGYAIADHRNICPVGWHVPSDAELSILTDFLGGASVAGGKMKASTLWDSPNTGATNESGFTGLPGGWRTDEGDYTDIGNGGYFWSSTKNDKGNFWVRDLYEFSKEIFRIDEEINDAISVRCIKD